VEIESSVSGTHRRRRGGHISGTEGYVKYSYQHGHTDAIWGMVCPRLRPQGIIQPRCIAMQDHKLFPLLHAKIIRYI